MSDNKWESQPRDEYGRFASRGVAAARRHAVKGTSSFAPLNALDNVFDNETVRTGLKVGLGVGAVAVATRFGGPTAAGLGIRTGNTMLFEPASKIYFNTPKIATSVYKAGNSAVQFSGRAAGYRRLSDNAVRGAVRTNATGKFNDNPFNKGFSIGKFPY